MGLVCMYAVRFDVNSFGGDSHPGKMIEFSESDFDPILVSISTRFM